MARRISRLWIACVWLGTAFAAWHPESGSLFVRSFTPKAYQASPQNWAAAQDRRGVMYFGNTGGILEYDGVSWRKIRVANGSGVRSLAVDDGGTVYAGAQGDFGYLKPDSHGVLEYVSLAGLVPPDARQFGDVWNIAASPDAVYFGASQGLYRWSPRQNTIRVWKPAKAFGRWSMAGGVLYAATAGGGLLRLRGETMEPVPGGEDFRLDVRSAFIAEGRLVLATRSGLFHYDGRELLRAAASSGAVIEERRLYAALPLDDGALAVATSLGGLLLLNRDGSLARQFGKGSGLLSDTLTSLFRDREGALWVTSSAGIERLDLGITQFGREAGLQGNTYAIARFAGGLYAGADDGLFLLHAAAGRAPVLEAVKGFHESVFALTLTRHGFLMGAQSGVYLVAPDRVSHVLGSSPVYDIVESVRLPGAAYAAGRAGLFELRREGAAWKPGRSLASGGLEFRSVAEDAGGRLWVGTRNEILRVDWRSQDEAVERFAAPAGVPEGWKNVYRLSSGIVFATSKGLLRFDDATSRFVPWTGFGAQFADGSRPVSIVRESGDGSVWITGDGYHGRLVRSGAGQWDYQPMPLLRADAAELYTVLPEADGTVWAAGADGFLIRYQPPPAPSNPPFEALLRRVQARSGLLPHGGAGEPAAPRLPYRENTLRFEFAAPFLLDPAKVEYQVRLDGADEEWSQWSAETRKDYTSLFEGGYRFEVRARHPQGAVSRPAAFALTILAPWYRAWWAYGVYALLAMGGVWGFVRWRLRKLQQEKAQLEVIVEERTVEIRQQRDQIQVEQEKSQSLLLNILPVSVADELKRTGAVQPQNFDDVTVCFTDFAGFTLSSEAMPAGALVSSLHEYFTHFDEIVERYGLEKLKTIGDSYMLVGGLPRPRRGHAVDAVLAALRMVEVVGQLAGRGDGAVWGVRIGLHSGPVAAGVVGVRKFAFDIWGNTVNLASRMESSGAPGCVNLSARTYALVSEFIACEPRGRVQTKDRREMEMYFARGPRPELADPEAFRALYRERFGEEPAYLDPAPASN